MAARQITGAARLALDTILQKPAQRIPTNSINIMEHAIIERLAGVEPGEYRKDPVHVYLAMQNAIGACLIDQFIPTNPLTMGDQGFESAERGPTTGADGTVLDGLVIDSPESVVEHMERFEFPSLRKTISEFDEDRRVRDVLQGESDVQEQIGPDILKGGYGFVHFPCLRYGKYGYEHYLTAYALYPEVMEKDFALQADLALLNNRAAARAYAQGNLPPVFRLDHDLAGSRGTLVDIDSLDRIWFPHFARCLEPMLKTNVRMLWHCDGNLMEMVPRLLDVGLRGFQGFQCECGMDYERICKMKTRDGEHLLIMAGVSVTRTLPNGTPDDVKRELTWLVENGPETGLILGASSSVAPGVPWKNIERLVEGLGYYRTHGRS